MVKMPEINRELLACLQCGYCLRVCPSYEQTPWESITPRGKVFYLNQISKRSPMDSLLGRKVKVDDEFVEAIFKCTGCAQCETVCHVNIEFGDFWEKVREWLVDQGKGPLPAHSKLAASIAKNRNPYGEPPATRGFTPSVFDLLPKLLERSGTSDKGSITGFYNVLVEGDDLDEPVSDAVRGILDGHLVLSRRLAERYHYPAVDVLASISRLAPEVSTPEEREAAGRLRRLLAAYAGSEDLINIGAYRPGTNPEIDEAMAKQEGLNRFLRQEVEEKVSLPDTLEALFKLAAKP